MDEANATRVKTNPDQVATTSPYPPKAYLVSLRISSPHSGRFLTGLFVEFLKRTHGVVVESVVTRIDQPPLASYNRSRQGL